MKKLKVNINSSMK